MSLDAKPWRLYLRNGDTTSMTGTGAARAGDLHTCGAHGGGPISLPASPDVQVNVLAAARATDPLACLSPAPNFIVTGSGSVLINGLPAVRINDLTMHPQPGPIVLGSLDVFIGGPTVGATLGNPVGAAATFEAMAKGRTSKVTQQSWRAAMPSPSPSPSPVQSTMKTAN